MTLLCPVVCAWCRADIRAGDPSMPVSHGICKTCLDGQMQVLELMDLSTDLADQLPWGLIRLRGTGEVVEFNAVESAVSHLSPQSVIGRHFFNDVAPCTKVREFQGRLEELRASGRNGSASLAFTFNFPGRPARVSVRLVYRASDDTSAILVQRLD